MLKRIAALILIVSTLFLSSCGLLSDIKKLLSDLNFINDNRDEGGIEEEFDETVLNRIENRFGKIDEILADNDSSRSAALIALYNQQMNDVYYLRDHETFAAIEYYTDTTSTEADEQYKRLTELQTGYTVKLYKLYRRIYESAYAEDFYKEWDKEDIAEALTLSDQYNEKFETLTNKRNDYVREYQKHNLSDKDYLTSTAEIYEKIVQNNREIAKDAGYDYFPDYSYEWEYGRNYSPKDAEKVFEYVKEYVVPLSIYLHDSIVESGNAAKIDEAFSPLKNKTVGKETLVDTLTPYYTALGGSSLEHFDSFLDNYIAVNGKNSLRAAFTTYLLYYDHPLCFFGPDDQSLLTYVHEQGHYIAFEKSGNVESVDLCEVHSQGNEWLYLNYIKGNYDKELYQSMIEYSLFDELLSVILCTCCDAFERYVYAHPELTSADYDKVYIDMAKELGAYEFLIKNLTIKPEEYWHRAIVSNSMYYLSYAVSLIPSIELFVVAEEEGFDAAARIYNKLNDTVYNADFCDHLTDCGLHSPFDKAACERISKHFSKR